MMHIEHDHKVKVKKTTEDATQQKVDQCFQPSTSAAEDSKRGKDFMVSRRMVLWLCRSLLPFSMPEQEGFVDFWKSMKFKEPIPKLPSRATVSGIGLDDVYMSLQDKLNHFLQSTPQHGVIGFDGWTDNYRRRHYITITYHTLINYQMKCFVLKTTLFDSKQTGGNIKNVVEKTLNEKGLGDKSIFACTDGGSNMILACKKLKIIRFSCFAHRLHRLIMFDFLENPLMLEIKELFDKLRSAQRKLIFAHNEIIETEKAEHNKNFFEMLRECIEIGKNRSIIFFLNFTNRQLLYNTKLI